MKKITHYYTCVLCSKILEAPGDLGNLSKYYFSWTKIDLRTRNYGGYPVSLLVCIECIEKDSPQKVSLLSSNPSVPPGYVDHKIIQAIHCDGQDCPQKEEKIIGPPHRIPIGVHSFPWTVVTGGPIGHIERYYCPKCTQVLQPRQWSPFESNPSLRHVVVEGDELDIGGILKIQ